jgi:NADPH:quinone reductase-like Zn-dependent oxidoreductase
MTVSFRIASVLTLLPIATRAFAATSNPLTFVTKPSTSQLAMSERYSMADQEARFSKAKKENNQRFLDITTVYDPSFLKGKRVAITGANRGLGLALAKEVTEAGADLIAIVRATSDELEALKPAEVITGVDVRDDKETAKINEKIKGGPIDIVSCHIARWIAYDFQQCGEGSHFCFLCY